MSAVCTTGEEKECLLSIYQVLPGGGHCWHPPITGSVQRVKWSGQMVWCGKHCLGCYTGCLHCAMTGDMGDIEEALLKGWQPGWPFHAFTLGPTCHKPLTIIPTFLLHQTPYPPPPHSFRGSWPPALPRKQRTLRKHQFLLSSWALACVLSQPNSSCNWTPLFLLLSHCLSVNIYLFLISCFPSSLTFTSHPVTQLSLLYFQRPSLNYTFFPTNLYVHFLLQALLVNPWSLLFHHGLSLFFAQPTPFLLEFVLFTNWFLEAALWPEHGFLLPLDHLALIHLTSNYSASGMWQALF